MKLLTNNKNGASNLQYFAQDYTHTHTRRDTETCTQKHTFNPIILNYLQ